MMTFLQHLTFFRFGHPGLRFATGAHAEKAAAPVPAGYDGRWGRFNGVRDQTPRPPVDWGQSIRRLLSTKAAVGFTRM